MQRFHRKTADCHTMAWKNGGGSTTEIAIYPPDMKVTDPFIWRLSKAELRSSGAFSTFPGYERHILQLDGGKVTLDHGEHGSKDLSCDEPHIFSGDWTTYGNLDQGTAHDLNLIVLRSHAQGAMLVYRLNQAETISKASLSDFTILVLTKGKILAKTPEPITLVAGDSLTLVADAAEMGTQRPVPIQTNLEATTLEPSTLVWLNINKTK